MSGQEKITICGGFGPISFPTERQHFQGQALSKGRQLLQGEHLRNVREERENGKVFIRASCLPETRVRQGDYNIEFEVSRATREVVESRCSCVAGVTGTCKHAAAAFLFVNEERSTGCTDDRPTWKKPSKKAQDRYPKGQTLEDLFNLPPTPAPSFRATDAQLGLLKTRMEACGLQKACLYKSLTAEKEQDVALQEQGKISKKNWGNLKKVLMRKFSKIIFRSWRLPCHLG